MELQEKVWIYQISVLNQDLLKITCFKNFMNFDEISWMQSPSAPIKKNSKCSCWSRNFGSAMRSEKMRSLLRLWKWYGSLKYRISLLQDPVAELRRFLGQLWISDFLMVQLWDYSQNSPDDLWNFRNRGKTKKKQIHDVNLVIWYFFFVIPAMEKKGNWEKKNQFGGCKKVCLVIKSLSL